MGSMPGSKPPLAVFWFVAVALPAQSFVVDAANGPGTHFTSITAAVAAVPDGATLLVRQGNYAGFGLSGKGIRILCDPGANLTGPAVFLATQPSQPIVLRGLTWPSTIYGSGYLIWLGTCAGLVVLEDLKAPQSRCMGCAQAVFAVDCQQVVIRSCLLGAARLAGCDLVIDGGSLRGADAIQSAGGQLAETALTLSDCTAQIVGAQIAGGNGTRGAFSMNDAGAIVMTGTFLRIMQSTVASGFTNGNHLQLPAIAAQGSNVLRLDPSAVVTSASILGVITGVAPQVTPMPSVRAAGAPTGGTMTATVDTLGGDLVILLLGLPGPPLYIRGLTDAFWLDPAASYVHTIGHQLDGAPITASAAVPSLPQLRGRQVVWQAVVSGPVTGFQDSNPAFALVR